MASSQPDLPNVLVSAHSPALTSASLPTPSRFSFSPAEVVGLAVQGPSLIPEEPMLPHPETVPSSLSLLLLNTRLRTFEVLLRVGGLMQVSIQWLTFAV